MGIIIPLILIIIVLILIASLGIFYGLLAIVVFGVIVGLVFFILKRYFGR